MVQSTLNSNVDAFLSKAGKWKPEMMALRKIILTCPLAEALKWGKPCYTLRDKNVVLIVPFKNYCALLLPKGALIRDPKHILVRPTENTQAARQVRFTNIQEITKQKSILKTCIQNAIEVEKSDRKIHYKKTVDFTIPGEFQKILRQNSSLKNAFGALTPGRQRAYLLYFSAPKQSKTREARIEKYMRHILEGKGLHD